MMHLCLKMMHLCLKMMHFAEENGDHEVVSMDEDGDGLIMSAYDQGRSSDVFEEAASMPKASRSMIKVKRLGRGGCISRAEAMAEAEEHTGESG